MTTSTRALPERYRRVWKIEKGYQLHAQCGEHDGGHWVTVTSVLHVTAPLRISSFTLDVPDCLAVLRRISERPDGELFSRRPAVAA